MKCLWHMMNTLINLLPTIPPSCRMSTLIVRHTRIESLVEVVYRTKARFGAHVRLTNQLRIHVCLLIGILAATLAQSDDPCPYSHDDGWSNRPWIIADDDICLAPECTADDLEFCHNPSLDFLEANALFSVIQSPGIISVNVSWTTWLQFGAIKVWLKTDDGESIVRRVADIEGDSGTTAINLDVPAGLNVSLTYKIQVYLGLNRTVKFATALTNTVLPHLIVVETSTLTTTTATSTPTSTPTSTSTSTPTSAHNPNGATQSDSFSVGNEPLTLLLTTTSSQSLPFFPTLAPDTGSSNTSGNKDSLPIWLVAIVILVAVCLCSASIIFIGRRHRRRDAIKSSNSTLDSTTPTYTNPAYKGNAYATIDENYRRGSGSPSPFHTTYALPIEATPPSQDVETNPSGAIRSLQYALPQDADILNRDKGKNESADFIEPNATYGDSIGSADATYSAALKYDPGESDTTTSPQNHAFYSAPIQSGGRPYTPDGDPDSPPQVVYNCGSHNDNEYLQPIPIRGRNAEYSQPDASTKAFGNVDHLYAKPQS